MISAKNNTHIFCALLLLLFTSVNAYSKSLNQGLRQDTQGNFTDDMLVTIKNIITYSNSKFPQTRLAQIAQFISLQLGNMYQPFWDVIVFDNTTTKSYVSAPYAFNGQWLSWYNYGPYKLGYHIQKQVICIAKFQEDTLNFSRSSVSASALRAPYEEWGRESVLLQKARQRVTFQMPSYTMERICKTMRYIFSKN